MLNPSVLQHIEGRQRKSRPLGLEKIRDSFIEEVILELGLEG